MTFIKIVKKLYSEGGIAAFYRGLGLIACGSMPAHAAYFSVYELMRRKFGVNDEENHPYLFALTGATAAFFHDLILTPIDGKISILFEICIFSFNFLLVLK